MASDRQTLTHGFAGPLSLAVSQTDAIQHVVSGLVGPSPSVPDFVGSASLVAAVWKRKDQTSLFININVLHKCTNNTIRVEGQLTSDCAADFAAGGTDAGAVPHHAVLRPLVGRTHRVRLVVVFVIAGLLPCRMHQRRVSTCGLNV